MIDTKVLQTLVLITGNSMRNFLVLFISFTFSFSIFATEEITLKLNEEKTFKAFTMKLTNINNSLCPKDARCVWRGNITTTVVINEKKYSFSHYPEMEFEEKAIGKNKIKILKVDLKNKTATYSISKLK